MGWLIFWGIVAAFIIAGVVNSNRKEQEKRAFHNAQISPAASQAVTVGHDSSKTSWTVRAQDIGLWEQTFVLAATDGPAYLMRYKAGLAGGRLFINDTETRRSSSKGTEDFPFSVSVAQQQVDGRVTAKNTMSGTTLTVYVGGQYVGQVVQKN